MSTGQIQRVRIDAAQKADVAARKTHRMLHLVEVDEELASKVPSVVTALKAIKRIAEQASLERSLAAQDHIGSIQDAENTVNAAQCAAQRAELALALARHASMLNDQPFGSELAHRVARALRAGVVVRQQPEDRIEVDGRNLYLGVGLSFGSTGKADCPPYSNFYTSKDEVCFSVDSCWVGYEQEPVQHCAPVMLDQPGLHMGPHGLSPQELAADVCRSLPPELIWLHEEKFISFLASNSERSLALLLGSGRQGSITKQKLEGAASRHEHYVPSSGLAGTIWYGDRAFAPENAAADAFATRQPGKLTPMSGTGEALRSLANSREALVALERAVLDLEEQWKDGYLEEDAARDWLAQLVAQSKAIEEGVVSIETSKMGLVGEPVKGLKSDMKRSLKQLVKYVNLLSDQIGPQPST